MSADKLLRACGADLRLAGRSAAERVGDAKGALSLLVEYDSGAAEASPGMQAAIAAVEAALYCGPLASTWFRPSASSLAETEVGRLLLRCRCRCRGWATAAEAGVWLGVTGQRVADLVGEGRLPGSVLGVGKPSSIPVDAIEAELARRAS